LSVFFLLTHHPSSPHRRYTLQSGQHAAALDAYTRAVHACERGGGGGRHSFSLPPSSPDEEKANIRKRQQRLQMLPTLLCNRALMASKLDNHDASLRDAEAAVAALSSDRLERDADEGGWLAQLTKAFYRQAGMRMIESTAFGFLFFSGSPGAPPPAAGAAAGAGGFASSAAADAGA
jgi:hypothetical protein